ncbi:MAG: penicillin-binding protein 1B [Kangiellaceae bacterium]
MSISFHKFKSFLLRLSILIFVVLGFLTIYLDSIVKNEFKHQAWDIPAKVYARSLTFTLRQSSNFQSLISELELLGYRKKIKALHGGEYEIYDNNHLSKTLVIRTRPFSFWDGYQASQNVQLTIENNRVSQLINFTTKSNINFVRLEPLLLGDVQLASRNTHEDRELIKLSDLPPHFIQTLLVMEDANFYNHWGLSLSGIVRAAWNNLKQGKITSGGSTITQQLMKNHFLSNQKSFWRKGQEALMALLTEIHYDKNTILEAYINEIYLGQNKQIAIHGFARASQFYFDTPLSELDSFQIALLIGIVKGASFYNPRTQPNRAIERRNLVLKKMLENNLLSNQQYENAKARSLAVVSKIPIRTSRVPAFMGLVKKELSEHYSKDSLKHDGLKIFTSLDPIKQTLAENALKQRIRQLASQGDSRAKLQGALMLANFDKGEILAVVGDKNPNYIGFNRAVDAYRQTGSIIKPLVYLTALKQANKFNLASLISDKEITLSGSDGSVWSPQNYDKLQHGDEDFNVTLEEALVHSYNLATAHLALAVGIKSVANTINEFGFDRRLTAYPSIALGSKEMSVYEVLRLYQTIANHGVSIKPSAIYAVQDKSGNLLKRYSKKSEAVIDEEAAFLMRFLLSKVTQDGTAKRISDYFPEDILAGKTGTTNDLKDSWYAGFDNEQLAVVWLGRDDNQPIKLTGSSGALLVWADLFKKLGIESVDLSAPENVQFGYLYDGFFAGFRDCKMKKTLPFYQNYLPSDYKVCEM